MPIDRENGLGFSGRSDILEVSAWTFVWNLKPMSGNMRGGHLAFVSSPELYIGAIRGFLNRLQPRKDDDNR